MEIYCSPGFGVLNGQCTSCLPGTYSVGGSMPCMRAPVGFFASKASSSSYSPCMSSIFEGASSCFVDDETLCSEGDFMNAMWACEHTGPGYFAKDGISYLCGPDSFSIKGSSSCAPCDKIASRQIPLSQAFSYLCDDWTPSPSAPHSFATAAELVGFTSSAPLCEPISIGSTDFALTSVPVCGVLACDGASVVLSTCAVSGGTCVDDTFFRLYNSSGAEIATNDDFCGTCSQISFNAPSTGCDTFYLHQGCYFDGSCSATTAVSGATIVQLPGGNTSLPNAPAAQIAALNRIFSRLNGQNWKNAENWNTSAHVALWSGVKLDSKGNVVSLDLSSNGLSGSMPNFLSSLSRLEYLYLQGNTIMGTFPHALTYLTSLKKVFLQLNFLTGKVPSLHNLVNLEVLDISDNVLSGSIPAGFDSTSKLNFLALHLNYFTGTIPSALGSCAKLQFLYCHDNKLSGTIPSSLGNLNLQILDLAMNSLAGTVPSNFCRLTKLDSLILFSNILTGSLPPIGADCMSIFQIDLHSNLFSGSIPSSVGTASNVVNLYLYDNLLSGTLPSSYSGLVDLEDFYIQSNLLVGSIPSTISAMSSLQIIRLSNNNLSGSIPASLGDISELLFIELGNNKLSGSLAIEFKSTNKVVSIHIENNLLTGYLPSSICLLPLLSELSILNNAFPCYPSCIQADTVDFLGQLDSCPGDQDVALCDLVDSFDLSKLANMELKLPRLYIQSEHPRVVGTSSAQGNTYFVSNKNVIRYELTFDPRISEGSGNFYICVDAACEQLIARYIGREVPYAGVGSTPPLVIYSSEFYFIDIGLYGNFVYSYGFKATIQIFVRPNKWSCTSLTPAVTTKSLTGLRGLSTTPVMTAVDACSWYGVTCKYGTTVTSIALRAVGLGGTIPNSISKLTGLARLDFSYNSLVGVLPSEMGSISSLRSLDLTSNRINGTIPSSFAMMKLQHCSLANNRLRGTLPFFLAEMTDLTYLDLSANSFTGRLPAQLCSLASSPQNASIDLTSTLVSCYEECWEDVDVSRKSFSPSLANCAPSGVPTSRPTGPTSSPTKQPHSGPRKLTAAEISGIVLGSAFFLGIICYELFSWYQQHLVLKYQYLGLPVHEAVAHDLVVDDALIDLSLETAKIRDRNGKTAIELILDRGANCNITLSALYRLVADSLPFDPETGVPIDNPDEHNYALFQVVQSDTDLIVQVLKLLLENFWERVELFANTRDSHGRRCVDLASPRCKEAINRSRYLFRRYELKSGPPEHMSTTSIVRFATDHGAEVEGDEHNSNFLQHESFSVALKFMRHKFQFLGETLNRNHSSSDKYVLRVFASYDADATDDVNVAFRASASQKGYEDYPYCIVMEVADKNLKRIIEQHNIAGSNWDEIRHITKQVLQAMSFFHSQYLIHGDIKSLNIVQVGHTLKLIDLDASASFLPGSEEFVGFKYSSSVLPPEMIFRKFNETCVVRSFVKNSNESPSPVSSGRMRRAGGFELEKASPAMDMWAFGALFYLLCTGLTLFQATVDDSISKTDMRLLCDWNASLKAQKLSIVPERMAHNLLYLLLRKDPKKRIDAAHALEHPFFTGKNPCRLIGEEPEFDVFLSYRVDSDLDHVEMVYNALTAMHLKVWWDKLCLDPGHRWEDGFCDGLINSACFVCIVSQGAINHPTKPWQNFNLLTASSRCDNVLLEWRLALELKERDLLAFVHPIFIGGKTTDPESSEPVYTDYFASNHHPTSVPDIVVQSVESKLAEHLDRQGLGQPYHQNLSVAEVTRQITESDHGLLRGNFKKSLDAIVQAIFEKCQRLSTDTLLGSSSNERTT